MKLLNIALFLLLSTSLSYCSYHWKRTSSARVMALDSSSQWTKKSPLVLPLKSDPDTIVFEYQSIKDSSITIYTSRKRINRVDMEGVAGISRVFYTSNGYKEMEWVRNKTLGRLRMTYYSGNFRNWITGVGIYDSSLIHPWYYTTSYSYYLWPKRGLVKSEIHGYNRDLHGPWVRYWRNGPIRDMHIYDNGELKIGYFYSRKGNIKTYLQGQTYGTYESLPDSLKVDSDSFAYNHLLSPGKEGK